MGPNGKRFGSHSGLTLQLRKPVEGYRSGTFVVIDPLRSGMRPDISFDEICDRTMMYAKTPDGNTIHVVKEELT